MYLKQNGGSNSPGRTLPAIEETNFFYFVGIVHGLVGGVRDFGGGACGGSCWVVRDGFSDGEDEREN